MKTKLTLLLLFVTITAFSQTAQQKFDDFKERLKTYKLSDLPADQQQDTITKWYQLESASIFEQAQSEQAQKVSDSIARVTARANYILHLKSVGFACDNSKADWRKAYQKPEWFGARWQTNADASWANSTGLDDFLNFCKQYNY